MYKSQYILNEGGEILFDHAGFITSECFFGDSFCNLPSEITVPTL